MLSTKLTEGGSAGHIKKGSAKANPLPLWMPLGTPTLVLILSAVLIDIFNTKRHAFFTCEVAIRFDEGFTPATSLSDEFVGASQQERKI
jgi:hypothetical protein